MRFIYINILCLIISIFTNNQLLAATHDSNILRQINRVNLENGLSSNDVTTLFRDSRGYIWIATYDGLNCYNGYLTKIYKSSVDNELLPSNRVRAINEDSSGRLWIGTDRGLVIYDYDQDRFIVGEKFREGGIIRHIVIVDDLIYAISESKGIFIFDMQLNLVRRDYSSDDTTYAESIEYNNSLLIASSDGIVEYDIINHKFRHHLKGVNLQINTIAISNTGHTIFVGSKTELTKLKITNNYNGNIELEIADKYESSFIIKKLKTDQNGALWIGTTHGGLIYVPDYKVDITMDNNYLVNRRISDFLMTSNGDMWVSTFDSGIYLFTLSAPLFKSTSQSNVLKMPYIYFIDDYRLLIGSDYDVYIYNTKTNKYDSIPISLQQLFNIKPLEFTIDSDQLIWLICQNGVYSYDIKTEETKFLGNPAILASKKSLPMTISCDGDGNIWLGYLDDIVKIDISKNGEIERAESILNNEYFTEKLNHRIRTIYHDSITNSTWIGTDLYGLYIIPTNEGLTTAEIRHYTHDKLDKNSLSSNFVSSILRDNYGVMWVSTEQGGLCRVDETDDNLQFKCYTEEEGLSNNVVKAMMCDQNGILWIATNVGLNSFNTVTDKFQTYRCNDELPFEEFLYSSAKSSNGQLFFTGANNIMYFNPEELPKEESLPKLYFNNLYIYDYLVKPNELFENRTIINHRLKSGDSFTLEHDENNFSISIDAIYEQNISYHHYHYILEPANTKWITKHVSNNVLSFNSLSPGRYTLRLMASNSQGDTTPEQQLNINIKPPFYNSAVAYIIYVVLLLMVIVAIMYSMMHTQSLHHKILLEAQEKESLRRTNLERQHYFSNISHELKTPLTLIMAPLSILSDHFLLDTNIKANLAIMQRQVKKMLQLIDLAHGIQLSDENRLVLNRERFIMRDLLKEISEDFEFLANFDRKQFVVEYPSSVLCVDADRSMLDKILNNLLNNAFKYTVAEDRITINYLCDGEMLTLRISDSGAGIITEDQPRIFDRFYTSKSIETKRVGGTGIGLAFSKYMVELHGGTIRVESEYGRGTTFIIELPIVVEQKAIDEYSVDDEVQDEKSFILGSLELECEVDVDPAIQDRLVYVVEDNGEMRAFISEVVGRYFNVVSHASAAECLSTMESQWPDIIVSDVMMPDMDGDKMCEVIKSDIRTSHIPIILLTARNTVDDKIKGIELGADSYIGKPFYPKHLITRIGSLLKGRQGLYEHFQKGLPFKQSSQVGGVSSRDSELLTTLYKLFDDNLDNELIEIDSFAAELGLNRSLFYSKIKALTDISPYELLKNYRLQRANELILSGKYNINEVCEMTGFKSRPHFSRVFKQHFGIAPSKVITKE